MTQQDTLYIARDAAEIAAKRLRLKQTRHTATGLLLLMTALFLVSTYFEASHPALPYVVAFSEAAMVGALADWFAIVALFRRPMGLPIPHTAILPRSKGRIADNLGSFIQSNFLSTERILGKLQEFNPAARLSLWLNKPQTQKRMGSLAVRAASYALNVLDDRRVLAFLQGSIVAQLQKLDLSRFSGDLLQILTSNGRHHALLDELLQEIDRQLERPEVRSRLTELIASELDFLRYIRLDHAASRFVVEKLVRGMQKELQGMHANPDHALRMRFDQYVAGFVEKLKHDPEFQHKGEAIKLELLQHPALATYAQSLWQQFVTWLHADLHRTDSTLRAHVVELAATLGQRLQEDPALQGWINAQIAEAAPALIEEYRDKIGQFIAEQVKAWDDRYMVDRLELNIGPDLQFIRVNGTLVGGCIGLLIHVVSLMLQQGAPIY